LQRWLRARPRSAEAHYYKAWLALTASEPAKIVEAINQASKLGFDPTLLGCLTAVCQARANGFKEAEPTLREAFNQRREPQVEVAQELARIYLGSYRLGPAAEVIERWRTLAPDDPRPYLWRNEIASRSEVEPSILIRNYRAALERDPNLDKARLGLAEQLSKERLFDEAEQEYRAYIERNPKDASALVGLGRNAFQNGDIENARRYYEAALEVNPRQPEALKELALAEIRIGRFQEACKRLELLIQIEPYSYEVRYSYAQVLKLLGDDRRSGVERDRAGRLRKEHDQLLKLRNTVLTDSKDVETRFQVAKWMIEHGHGEEGLNWTKEVLRLQPRHVPTHRLLADYHQQRGDTGLANYHRLIASTGKE
jgi:tetratricopeptide (TPR) repeat protein